MDVALRPYWADLQKNFLTEEESRRLLFYVAFVYGFCQKQGVSRKGGEGLPGQLQRLFLTLPDYELRDAAVAFEQEMPWDVWYRNAKVPRILEDLMSRLEESRCWSPHWLKQQADALLADERGQEFSVTPESLRLLIGRLAAQRPAERIVDLCSGSALLALETWWEMGCRPGVACRGEERSPYLCSLSRLLLYLCGVADLSVWTGDVTQWQSVAPEEPACVYVADFPLTGSSTVPARELPWMKTERTGVYMDWVLIQTVLNRMRPGERGFMVVARGALVRRNEASLRKELLERDWLSGVVTLPGGLCPGHTLPAELLICEKDRPREQRGKILFADLGAFSEVVDRRARRLTEEGIARFCRAFARFGGDDNFVRVATREEVLEQQASFNPQLYLARTEQKPDQIALEQAAHITRGIQSSRPAVKGLTLNRYLLNVRDIQDGRIHYESAERIDWGDPALEEKFRIREDDIILTSKGTALKMAIVPPNPPPAYISGNLTLIRAIPERCPPYVLYEYLDSPEGRQALSLIQSGSTIRVLNSGNLGRLSIPKFGGPAAAEVGRELKEAALRYREEREKLDQTYQRCRQELLERLKERKEKEP